MAATLKGHRGAVNAIEFSRDGQSVITASRDGTARIWSVTGGVERAILKGHRGNVTEAALSPSGLYAVTASPQDRTVRLWSANTGRQIAVLSGQEKGENVEPVTTHATFNSDGTRLAIISGDKVARIIRVFPTPQDLIDYAKSVVPRELTPCERRRFFLPVEGDVGECPA